MGRKNTQPRRNEEHQLDREDRMPEPDRESDLTRQMRERESGRSGLSEIDRGYSDSETSRSSGDKRNFSSQNEEE
jgi:hypothetical protein